MRFLSLGIIIIISFILSACASYPRNPPEQAAHHVKRAQAAIAKGHIKQAVDEINTALIIETGNEKIKSLFDSQPIAKNYYINYLENIATEITTAYQAEMVYKNLNNAKDSGVLSSNIVADFFEKMNKTVVNGNISGSIPFDLGDSFENFPELQTPFHKEIIVNRSINNLQDKNSSSRRVAGLMDYVRSVGVNSIEGKRIEAMLPTMNIRKSELNAVASLYPKFANERRAEITTRVYFDLKNGNRLLSDDLLEVFRAEVRGVEWVEKVDPNMTTLIIERVQDVEKTLPETSQTVTYAQHEVNIFSAALLMPRNATYHYEVASGGSQIEYGYVVTATMNGKKVHDEVIRGKVGGNYKICRNARIQNVFGGVSPAGFTANDDMQNRCSGPSAVSLEQLRKEVLMKIKDGVLRVSSIKNAHELNK
jgi:hypothetical protein